jgi:hypothetical protein
MGQKLRWQTMGRLLKMKCEAQKQNETEKEKKK